jgi:hypothetical protein
VPLTVPAHQAVVLPLKLRWPALMDGTALCVGAAAPDLAYPLGHWMYDQSHTAVGIVVWAVPFTLAVCAVLRWRAAAGVAAQLPDLPPFRFRSYGVLSRRRPLLAVTAACALIGAVSHVVLDAFTHSGRWGARWLGLDHPAMTLPVRGEITYAKLLQYAGHVGGSVVTVLLLWHIGRRRLLESWYGVGQVRRARAITVTSGQRVVFWTVALAPPAVAAAASGGPGRHAVFLTLLGGIVGLLLAGSLPLRAVAPSDRAGAPTPEHR